MPTYTAYLQNCSEIGDKQPNNERDGTDNTKEPGTSPFADDVPGLGCADFRG